MLVHLQETAVGATGPYGAVIKAFLAGSVLHAEDRRLEEDTGGAHILPELVLNPTRNGGAVGHRPNNDRGIIVRYQHCGRYTTAVEALLLLQRPIINI